LGSSNTVQRKIRLGVLVSHPVQYFSPWFRDLAKVLDLKVFYIHRQSDEEQARAGFGVEFDWDVPLLAGYPHAWLQNEAGRPGVDRFFGCDVPTLETTLQQENLDALLVFGWRHKSSWQAYRACRRLGIPILMKGDSGLHTPRSLFKRGLKRLLYRFLLPRFDGHLYIGQANRAYLAHYGVGAGQLFFSPLCVDGHWFAEKAAEAEESDAPARLRAEMGIDPQSFVFLFVGKFISIKQPDRFLRAFFKLRALHPQAKLDAVLVGQGPMQSQLAAIGARCPERIHFAGFKNQTQLPAYYRMADSLVLPGHDSWGLVVNEAAACGVPALVSDGVGCARDLIIPGETGFVFGHDDTDDMVRRMDEMRRCVVGNPMGIARSLGRKCEDYGPQAATRGLQAALAQVVHARSGTGRGARDSGGRISIPKDEGSEDMPRRQREAC